MQETSLFVGILDFLSSWNFMLSWVEHEKSFITSEPVFDMSLYLPLLHLYWYFEYTSKQGSGETALLSSLIRAFATCLGTCTM